MRSGPLLILVLGLCLAGCATRPVSLRNSRQVIPSHIIGEPAGVLTSMEQGGKIIVTRDSGVGGSASLLKIFVDGAPVAKLDRYERYEVILNEGDHLLAVIGQIRDHYAAIVILSACVTGMYPTPCQTRKHISGNR